MYFGHRLGRGFAACQRLPCLLATMLLLYCGLIVDAQELEPRRWSHLPANINVVGVGYAFTRADILFDPVLEAEDVNLDLHTFAAKYIRTFGLLNHSARVDVSAPYQDAHWEGLLQGVPATRTRSGFSDPSVRFSMNLLGGPPLEGAEFAQFRATHQVETIVGAGLTAKLPLGQYYDDKLLNLGENRFAFQPELGAVHNHRKWSTELTGSAAIYTDNDDFWNGNTLEQNPLYFLQAHLVYTFRPGLWVGGSTGYGYGGESYVNGVDKDDGKNFVGWALSLGYPLNKSVGVKLAYVGSRTQASRGFDSDTVAAGLSVLW
jgi:hypothetical protein